MPVRILICVVAAIAMPVSAKAESVLLHAAGSLRGALNEVASAFETVGADYGLTVMADVPPDAYRLATFILSEAGQRILMKHGFAAPTLPQ